MSARVAVLVPAVLLASAAWSQGPPKPRSFPPPEPAREVVIRPGAVISLGIPDAPPPVNDGRPTQPGAETGTGQKPPADPFGGAGNFGDKPGGKPSQPDRPGQPTITNPNEGRPTQPNLPTLTAGAFPAGGELTPPEGIGAAGPLRVERWAVWRRITDHGRNQPAFTLYALRIAADGSRIAIGGYEGVRTLKPDGSAYTVVSTKRTEDGCLDISDDGSKVAWFSGDEGLWIANADGSGRTQLAAKGVCHSVRISGDGRQVFAINSDLDGIAVFPSDGGPGRAIVTTKQAAEVAGVDVNGNHWRGGRSGLDVSADGRRLVYQFLWDAFALDVPERTVRQLTKTLDPEDRGLQWVRVSRDGSRIAWRHESASPDNRYIRMQRWNGSGDVRHAGDHTAYADWAQFSYDGARLGIGWGLRFYPSDGSPAYHTNDLGSLDPLPRAQRSAVAGSGSRSCVEVEEAVEEGRNPCAQIYVVDFCPKSLAGAPALNDIQVNDLVLRPDNASSHFVEMRYVGAGLDRAGVVLARPGGSPVPALRGGMWDGMKDPEGSQPPASGPRPLKSGRLAIAQGQSVPPGPVTIRVWAKDKEARLTVVDLAGLEAK